MDTELASHIFAFVIGDVLPPHVHMYVTGR